MRRTNIEGGGTFPNLDQFLAVKYPKVRDVLVELGMLNFIRPRRGTPITFVVPSNGELEKISSLLSSDKGEEASKIMSKYILLGCFKDANDFMKAKTDNNLFTTSRHQVTTGNMASTRNDEVTIGGTKLELNKTYKPFESISTHAQVPTAVWVVKSGELTVSNAVGKPDFSKFKSGRSLTDKPTTKSKYEGGASASDLQKKFLAIMDKEFTQNIRANLGKKGKDVVSGILDAVVKILSAFKGNQKMTDNACSILTMEPIIDLTLLCNCSKLFDPDVVSDAIDNGVVPDKKVNFYRSFFNDSPSNSNFSHIASIDRSNFAIGMDTSTIRSMLAGYDNLSRNNSLGSPFLNEELSNIYPESFSDILKQEPKLLLHLHEKMLIMWQQLCEIRRIPFTQECIEQKQSAYLELLNIIKGFDLNNSSGMSALENELDFKMNTYVFATCFAETFMFFVPYAYPRESSRFSPFSDYGARMSAIHGGDDGTDVVKTIQDFLDKQDNKEFELSRATLNEIKAFRDKNGRFPGINDVKNSEDDT